MQVAADAEQVSQEGPRPARSPWLAYSGRRLLRLVVSLWALVTFAFLIVHLIPGDPVRAALGLRASQEAVDQQRAQLGLDEPILVQYWTFVSGVLHGDLGQSIQLKLPVASIIGDRLPATLVLALLAFLVTVAIAFPLGIVMAIRTQRGRNRGSELGFVGSATVLAAIPDFVLAVVLVFVFAVSLRALPIAGRGGASSYVIPVIALSLGSAAALARIVRVETLGVLQKDYIRTARAKRLAPSRVYLRHAVPNALTASLTVGGLLLSGLLAGTVLVENVMAWPGLGQTMVSSIINKDYPLVQGIVLVYGALVLIINVGIDILLAIVDPRSSVSES